MEQCQDIKNINSTQKKYQIKDGFLLRQIAGEYTIIPVDAESLIFNAMMIPNDSAVFLWKAFAKTIYGSRCCCKRLTGI